MASASRIWNFVKSNLLTGYDVDLLGLSTIFHNKFRASCGRPRCVLPPFAETGFSSSTFRRDLFLHPQSLSRNLRRHRSPSRRPPRGCVFYFFRVLRNEHHLSIDRPVRPFFAWPAISCCCCWLRLLYRCCYTSSRHIVS